MRPLLLAAALLLTTSAFAAEPKPKEKAKTAESQKTPAATPKGDLVIAKRTFRTAVELCDAPGRCETGSRSANSEYITLLKDSEKRFVEVCERCASSEKCDEERQRIRDGKRTLGAQPCQ